MPVLEGPTIGRFVTVSLKEAFFDAVEAGNRYVIEITVHNTSMKGQRVRFVPPRASAFMLAVQNDVELAPGLELRAELSFCSAEPKDFYDKLVISIGRVESPSEQITIPVRALQPAAHLFFEPVLDFGSVVHGHTEQRRLAVENRGTRDGRLLISPQTAGSKFHVLPVEAVVRAGTSMNLKVEFNGSDLGAANVKLVMMIEGGTPNEDPKSSELHLKANCVKHLLELRDREGKAITEKLEFGRLYFGLETSVPLIVLNNGPHTPRAHTTRTYREPAPPCCCAAPA